MKLIVITFLLCCSFAFSQEHGVNSKNILYGEIKLNSDEEINLNFEHNYSISRNNKLRLAGRAGIGIGLVDQAKDSMTVRYSIPIEALLLYGRHNNLEVGIGFTPTFGKAFTNTLKTPFITYRNYESMYYLELGYRYIADGGFVIRVTPMIEFPSVFNRKPGFVFGLSFGYAL